MLLWQVVSLANPWLDFLSAEEAASTAKELNEDLESYCATYSPSASSTASGTKWTPLTQKRLFAFGSLPLVPGIEIPTVLSAIEQVRSAKHLRGVVMGTRGLGKGLDDDAMEPIWAALADSGLVVFVVRQRNERERTSLSDKFLCVVSTRITASRVLSATRTTDMFCHWHSDSHLRRRLCVD